MSTFWLSNAVRDEISILGLVASDAAYKKGGFSNGSFLQSYPDHQQSWEDFPVRAAVVSRQGDAADPSSRLAFSPTIFEAPSGQQISGVAFSNWRQFESAIEDPDTGAAAIIYERLYNDGTKEKAEYIVAFRGSDGRSGRDWFANIQLGKNQWEALFARLYGDNGPIRALTSPDGSIPVVHFTGQSLGGALAQYAAYEYVRQRETEETTLFDDRFFAQRSSLITLTTFNAFAAGLGLSQLYDGGIESFNPNRLSGVPTAHYSIENEIVHNLGGLFDTTGSLKAGFLNGVDGEVNNLYHFTDWRHWDTPPNSPPGSPGTERTGPQAYLGLVEGHRIETGFYQGLDRYNATFTSAVQGGDPSGLVKMDSLQAVGEIFARFLGGDRSSDFASWARVTAGVAMGSLFASVGDVARLLKLVGESLYKSGDINGFARTVIATDVGSHLTALSMKLLAKPTIAIAGASSLAAAIADLFGKAASATQSTELINRNISPDEQFQPVDVTPVNDETAAGAADSARHFGLLMDYLQPEILKGTVLDDDIGTWQAIADDPIGFTTMLYGGDDGYTDALIKLTNDANADVFAGDNVQTLNFGADVALFGAAESKRIARDTDIRASLDEDVGDYIKDLTAAVVNLSPDLLASLHHDTDIVLAPVSSNRDYRQLVDLLREELDDFRTSALFGLSASSAPKLDATLKEARATLLSAGETPVIVRFAAKPVNPFDDESFDADSAPAATGELEDGSAGTYVVFLPYDANPGGQKVKLELAGVPSEKVTVVSEGAAVPMADGAFVLIIAEGRRQAAFTLEAASDLGASGSLSISATLVDADGVATHRTQLEANIALKHEDQTFETVFDAASAADFRSADRIGGYFDQNDPTATRTQLVGTDHGDFFVGDHAAELIVGGTGNDFVVEGPGSGAGTYTAGDSVEAGAGNDVITGHLGDRISAGDGDDFVNPNDFFRLAASRLDPGHQGSLPEFPAAIYADLAGFLRVRPTGDEPVFNNLVGGLDFTYARDFGNSNVGSPTAGTSAKLGVVGAGSSTEIQRTAAGGAAFQFTTFNGIANIKYLGAATPLTYGVAFETTGDLHNAQAVEIDGGAGNDLLYGAGGEDFIQGGSGDDRMSGFLSDDTILGEEGNDQLISGAGDDYLDGGHGNDRLWGEGEDDGLWGGSGNDILFGDANTTPVALHGADYLDGGAGDDQLFGNGGEDELFGGDGVDALDGGSGNDYLDGESGSDTLLAGAGDDELYGGEDDDILTAADGIDYLDGQSGSDQLDGGAGADTLFGGDGTDVLIGGLDDDILEGEGGSDLLAGGGGNDVLSAGDGSDKLQGGDGDDRLNGGAGDNVLLGEAGDDTYVLSLGDGNSVIDDQAGANRIVYEAGIFPADVVAAYTDPALGAQDLVLTYGGSRATIRGGTSAIASLQFGDGTTLAPTQFLQTNLIPGFARPSNVLIGTAGNDRLADTSGRDVVVYALEGADVVETGAGNDVVDGGPGRDVLLGGRGNDVYRFASGDGEDRITDSDTTAGNSDSIMYAADILPAEVRASRSENDLVLTLGDTADRVTVTNYFQNDGLTPSTIEEIRFLADGTVWNLDTVKTKAITGSAGNDVLTGYASDDLVEGRAGHDSLDGQGGDDILDGGAGVDLLSGGPGNDTLIGGERLVGGTGDDTYVFAGGAGSVRIDEEHVLLPGSGFDTVLVAPDVASSQVRLQRTATDLELRLDDGSTLVVERQFDAEGGLFEPIEQIRFAHDGTTWDLGAIQAILGTPTDGVDVLWGTLGDDVLFGGLGDDTLRGGFGGDTYLFNIGDGHDTVIEHGEFESIGVDRVVFGSGITPANVTPWKETFVGIGTLALTLASGDSIRLGGYFGSFNSIPSLVEEIRFEDGTVWTDETIAPLFPIFGTEGSDSIFGLFVSDVIFLEGGHDRVQTRLGRDVVYGGEGSDTITSLDGNDRFYGEAGNDTLRPGEGFGFSPGANLLDGGSGNDVLVAPAGDDTLIGGSGDDSLDGAGGTDLLLGDSGSDTYVFGLGYGFDTIEDADPAPGSLDRVVMAGISPSQVAGLHTPTHRVLVLNQEDQLFIRWDPAAGYQIEEVRFGDGTVWDVATLLDRTATGLVTNGAPILANAIPNATAHEDAVFSFAVPTDSFSDPDVGDTLVYAATSADGGPLPAWLKFDANAVAFAGTPGDADVGAIELRLSATDGAGETASGFFVLDVLNINDAPVVAQAIADQAVDAESLFAFTVPIATFHDVDLGDSLALSATASDGGSPPAWLAFNPASATFSGAPQTADIGIHGMVVRATDTSGKSASSEFAVTVRALAGSSVSGSAGDDVIAGGTGDERLSGGKGNDALFGDVGDDVLGGGTGSDVLQGGAGADVLHGGTYGNVLDGGADDDVIFDGAGDSFISGGAGNDVVRSGAGNDVIAFNEGDGWDTIYGGGDGGNTLSLGGGIRYGDLSFSKSGDDLLVCTGEDQGMVFKDWYAGNQSVLSLQVILDATDEFDATSSDPLYNRRVQTFNFLGLVSAFDQARAASPGLSSWDVTNALLQWHLEIPPDAADAALGGDLAYWYGKRAGLAGLSLQAAQETIGVAGFGSDAQTLRPFSGLQEGFVKLS